MRVLIVFFKWRIRKISHLIDVNIVIIRVDVNYHLLNVYI